MITNTFIGDRVSIMMYRFLIAIVMVSFMGPLDAQEHAKKLVQHVQEGSLDKEKLEQLLNKGLNLVKQGDQALLQAILNKDAKTTNLLQSYGALPDDKSIALAVLLDDKDSLNAIITKGLTPWAIGNFDKDFLLCLHDYAVRKNLQVTPRLRDFTEQIVQLSKERLTPPLTPGI